MLADRDPSRAVVVLLDDEENADAVARMLSDLCVERGHVIARIPPVRGIAFFSDSGSQAALDAWWDSQIPKNAQVLFVLDDRDGIPEWLRGLDGRSYVGVTSPSRMSAYEDQDTVKPFLTRSPLDYAAAVMSDLVDEGVYDEVEASRARSLAAAFSGAVVSTSGLQADGGVDTIEPPLIPSTCSSP